MIDAVSHSGAFENGNGSSKPEYREDPPHRARRAENPRAARKRRRFARTGRPARRRAGRRLLWPLLCHAPRHPGTRSRQDFRGVRRAPLRRPEKFPVPERHDARVRRDADAPGIRFPESQRGAQLRLRQLFYGLAVSNNSGYFELFGLPRKLWIEMGALEQKFLQLSWKFHPDNFVNASEHERELSLQRSSELNDAYRVLRDPVARVEYLLGIEGARKEGEHKQQAPRELLEEVFELNESLDELREARAAGSDLAVLKARLESAEKNFQEKLGEVDAQLQVAAREWDAALQADAATRKKVMAQLNELLNRRSYIRNLVANVQKELL